MLDASLKAILLRELSPATIKILVCFMRSKFHLTLVGGAVRHLVLEGKLGNDLDFELSNETFHFQDQWEDEIPALAKTLPDDCNFSLESIEFMVLRVFVDGKTLEFAPARLESYRPGKVFAHGEFSTQFIGRRDYARTFKRRDFTVNAIGIELTDVHSNVHPFEYHWVDPFGGMNDLKAKKLRFCSQEFFKDPVRFLRLVRFSLAEGWSIDREIYKHLSSFDLSKMNRVHFFQEALKYDFLPFHRSFFELAREHYIKLPPWCYHLIFLEKHAQKGPILTDLKRALFYLVCKIVPPTEDEVAGFVEVAQMKRSLLKDFKLFRQLLEELEGIDEKTLKQKFQARETFLSDPQLKAICRLRRLVFRENPVIPDDLVEQVNPTLAKTLNQVLRFFPAQLKSETLGQDFLVERKGREVWKLYLHWSAVIA